jgi:hypothetical protein
MKAITPSEIWDEYQRGISYKTDIDLYETVKVNENMFIGKQWEGVNAPDLPKPVLNIMKRVVSYMIAMIVSDDVGISFSPSISTPDREAVAKMLAKEVERVIEQAKTKSKYRRLLRDAAVRGDCCLYSYFDPDAETGQMAKGDIKDEIIQNTNVYFGNPYVSDPQKQSRIIIAQRLTVKEAKAMAKKNEIPQEEWDLIEGDEDTNQNEKGDSGLCTVLICLERDEDTGTIWMQKTTQKVMVHEPVDLECKLFPLAWMNWEEIQSSCHGQAAITGLVPNQVSINRLLAMTIRSEELNAFPKIVYDSTKIKKWTNKIGEAIGVPGMVNEAIAQPIKGADVSMQVMNIIESVISLTRDFMGASDAALGNVKPDNTSAIIAVQQASAVPLELQRRSFIQFVEDDARVKVDLMCAHFGKREVASTEPEILNVLAPNLPMYTMLVDFKGFGDPNLTLNVDVGAATYWSEITQVQTLDGLFKAGIITDAVTYLESLPDHVLRNKGKIIEELKQQQQMQQQTMIPNTPQGV